MEILEAQISGAIGRGESGSRINSTERNIRENGVPFSQSLKVSYPQALQGNIPDILNILHNAAQAGPEIGGIVADLQSLLRLLSRSGLGGGERRFGGRCCGVIRGRNLFLRQQGGHQQDDGQESESGAPTIASDWRSQGSTLWTEVTK